MLEVNVRKRFDGGGEVSTNVVLPEGVTCLFGPSGSGKTTVLRMIAGLTVPTSGMIRFRGEDWTKVAVQKRGVAFVFQDYALFPHLTVEQNIRFGRPQGRVEPWLGRFGLEGLGKRYPREISAGQGQRVALARALMTEPRLLLLDEPLSALDSVTRAKARRELAEVLRDTGTPAVMVTHDAVEATALAGHVVVMKGGKVVQAGGLGEVFSSPVSAEVAEIVGVETILSGEVVASESGLVKVRVNGGELVAVGEGIVGRKVKVYLRAEDVALVAGAEQGEHSQRNKLSCVVEAAYREGALTRVILKWGEVQLTALITSSSAAEMGLERGCQVQAVIKATAVKLVD